MQKNPRIVELLKGYENDINDNNYEKIILDTYLKLGESGLTELKKIFVGAGLDMKPYNQAIERILKTLLKNSDLLD